MKNKVRFFLQGRENKDGKRLIYLSFRFDNSRLLCATGQMCEPRLWDAKRYRVKRGSLLVGVINNELERIELAIATAYTEQSKTGDATLDALKSAAFPVDNRDESAPSDLFALYRLYIVEHTGERSRATMQVHEQVIHHLERFTQTYNLPAPLSQITTPWFEKFISYLLNVGQLTNPSAEKVVRTLRAVLTWANTHGITTPDDYKRFTGKTLSRGQQSQKVYLNADDLQAIEAVDLRDNDRLRRVRDVLSFQCWTGVRYGDLLKLRREHVHTNADGESEIQLVTAKNRKAVRIPLLEKPLHIWQMYEGKLPTISNQRQNTYLKELCAMAGIDTPCLTVTYRGTKRIEKTLPKYDLIGTHTAKRTFVTLLALEGVSLASIMKITGNSRNTIEAYLVATDADAAREIREKFSQQS